MMVANPVLEDVGFTALFDKIVWFVSPSKCGLQINYCKGPESFFIDGRCFMDVFLNGDGTCTESTSTNMQAPLDNVMA